MKEHYRSLGLSKRQYRKLMRSIRHLFFQLQRWVRRRLAPLGLQQRRQGRLRWGRAGFVLPTVVIVLVVVTLTVAALMIRTLNRTAEVSGQRQEIQVMNATAPAIDRARAKLEYFFTQDPLRPNGVPGEDVINQIIGNQGSAARDPDPYTLADEQRIDFDGDGNLDNAWAFQPTPTSIVAYSILMKRPNDTQLNQSDADKARQLITRSRPMGITELGNQCGDVGNLAGQQTEVGWDEVTSAILRKNFQINAFVYENRNGGQALSTVEFVQERQMERGNKWGAWFRNDLEIFPGPDFRWNGAMHTEGSIFMTSGNGFTAYLVSSPKSCIYTRSASEITATEVVDSNTGQTLFQGQFVAGSLRDNNTNAPNVQIHSYSEPPSAPYTTGDADPPAQNVKLTDKRDSVKDGIEPAMVALNPVAILTEDRSKARGSDPTNLSVRDENWPLQFYVQQGRFANKTQPKPYVDDTYRADDRYGPKPVYDTTIPSSDPRKQIPVGKKVGDPIDGTVPGARDLLTRNVAPPGSPNKREDLGLDGYWERRARQEGLRIIVGERLELGKPLDPPEGNPADSSRRNEFYQHRTLRDDLAAVQAAVVYHYKARGTTIDPSIPDPFTTPYPGQNEGGYEPVACLAATYHHGTPQTALRSIMFNQYNGVSGLGQFFDFFTGRGTNGWEFEPPDFNSQDMRNALQNLANAYGDPQGAFPPTQGTTVHPDPTTTKAGNFSNLRRAMEAWENAGWNLRALSLADQSTIHTAGCALGMLAYSVHKLQTLSLPGALGTTLDNQINILRTTGGTSTTGPQVQIDGQRVDQSPPPYPPGTTSGVVTVIRNGFPSSRPLSYRGGYLDANAYITALISDTSWGQRPLQETSADVNARLARLIALREQVVHDLNPGGYQCSITDNYPNLKKAFCLDEQSSNPSQLSKRGFVLGQDFLMPSRGGDTPYLRVEDAPSYNFDLDPNRDRDKYVYVSGAGLMQLTRITTDEQGKILTVKLKNVGASYNAPQNRQIPAGASASLLTETGQINVAVGFPNNPIVNSTTVDINYTGLSQPLQVGDIIEIRRPPTGVGVLGRVEGVFEVVPSTSTLPLPPNTARVRYIGGTERSGSGSANIAVGSEVVVLWRKNSSPGPLGTFNTVIKYPALQRIFNGVTPDRIVATPRPNTSAFLTPTETATGNTSGFPNRLNQIIDFNGNAVNVAFLDNALFNGREEMVVREMDIDLDLLRRKTIGGDTWLPMGGIVYAFREDAVREDGIARPAVSGQNWMNTDPNSPHDPPLAANGISTKPVDFFADPMRRPNGFRLWNGARLDREGIPDDKNIAGLSFISDNPVYIQGDFNLHSSDGTTSNLIEEFTDKLADDWSNFYDRSKLDPRFARPKEDKWRPTEILADAVTILSSNFCNGSANDYFAEAYNNTVRALNNSPENLATNFPDNTGADARVDNSNRIYPTCAGIAKLRTSFLNANRPSADLPNDTVWLRESPFDPSSPIYVDRNGTPWAINYTTGERVDRNGTRLTQYPGGNGADPSPNNPYNAYYSFDDARARNTAQETRVNAVIVSGTVPSRRTQSYGGMHNFPRFLEAWGTLRIQGSFIQLNFSTQATAPFDQDQWEIPNDPSCQNVNTAFNCSAKTWERIQYYGAPQRRWGYDVALQLAPAGPVARRFITPGRQRTEYYTELRADDPYILRLRCARRPAGMGGGRIDPNLDDAQCDA
ncbi:hormogonium polysaccharide biosynthesis protein HpsA [Thermosynechococcus vestitus]|uniref:Tlr0678 protein n=1 Tax=Thermosynechococcus vestitus (strain NIES-2133 / IAM M-273 / BP-1) TaxID=197221 RepID=Q8DL21_THEVB|nr:hormogonium polysaccharide biosynthesis protein HpsA [Thermosynechococcus vestitus]BAC08229.1 tlr0678 [Thermosynechococcus vestitus BP-1]